MIKIKHLKALRSIAFAIGFIFLALGVFMYVPQYVFTWERYFGLVVMGLLVAAFILPVSKEIIGNPAAKIPWRAALQHIMVSYGIIILFGVSFLILLVTTLITPSAQTITDIIKQNSEQLSYHELAYPWMLYTLGVIIVGVIGYQVQQPKTSGALAAIIPVHYLRGFSAAIIDFMAVLGFLVGLIPLLIGLNALALAKLIGDSVGYSLDYSINFITLGLGFALVYLPFSPLWKTLIPRFQALRLNLGLTLLLLIVGLGIFTFILYAVLHLFLEIFANYFQPLENLIPKIETHGQLAHLYFPDLLWALSMITLIIVAGWWVQYVQGYSVRQAILITLAPFALLCGIYQIFLQTNIDILMIITWLTTPPLAQIFALLSGLIIALACWRENYFVQGLFWILPNLAGRKLSRWRKNIIENANTITFGMMFCILLSLYYVKVLIFLFAVLFSFALILVIPSVVKYLLNRKLLW